MRAGGRERGREREGEREGKREGEREKEGEREGERESGGRGEKRNWLLSYCRVSEAKRDIIKHEMEKFNIKYVRPPYAPKLHVDKRIHDICPLSSPSTECIVQEKITS